MSFCDILILFNNLGGKMEVKKKKLNLGVAILISMVLGILVGALMGEKAHIFAPLGDVFIHGIKMMVIPLVTVSIILAVGGFDFLLLLLPVNSFIKSISSCVILIMFSILFFSFFSIKLFKNKIYKTNSLNTFYMLREHKVKQ